MSDMDAAETREMPDRRNHFSSPEKGLWKYKVRSAFKEFATKATCVAAIGVVGLSAIVDNQEELAAQNSHFEMNIQDLRDIMTIPHFAKISGIASEMIEEGVDLPASLDLRVRYATRIAEAKHTQYEGFDDIQIALDMARSEGALEVREGEWNVENLEIYIEEVMALDKRFFEVADAASAFLQHEGISSDDADNYVRRSIAISYSDFQLPGLVALTEDDTRLEISDPEHREIVSELHGRMHRFFQNRLNNLEVSDSRFRLDLSRDADSETPEFDI